MDGMDEILIIFIIFPYPYLYWLYSQSYLLNNNVKDETYQKIEIIV